MKMSGRAFLEKPRQDLQLARAPMNLRHAAAAQPAYWAIGLAVAGLIIFEYPILRRSWREDTLKDDYDRAIERQHAAALKDYQLATKTYESDMAAYREAEAQYEQKSAQYSEAKKSYELISVLGSFQR